MLPSDRGTYILLLRSSRATVVAVGRWGDLAVRRGWYLYVGSAFGPGGLAARVGRHCRADRPARWHVDHLRRATALRGVCFTVDPSRLEHRWADALACLPELEPVPGVGCSDCDCRAHLFFAARRPDATRLRAVLPGRSRWTGCGGPVSAT